MRRSLLLAAIISGRCLAANTDASELIEFSLEDLMSMEIEVTTSSKREQSVFDSASAAFVVTAEDIRRNGVTDIPGALRMVPGVFVGEINNNEWAISVRGLGGRFSRYLQVLIDGRSIFDTFFNTINWDEVNLTLSDIDRIEVIRGPGASVWGANAVNGVINIVTRRPHAEDGTEIKLGGGSYTKAMVSGQTSHAFGENTTFRLSGNYQEREGREGIETGETEGDASAERLAMAMAHKVGKDDWLLNLDLYQMRNDNLWLDTTPYGVASSNGSSFFEADDEKEGYAVQLRYSHQFSDVQTLKIRASADDIERTSRAFLWDTRNVDLDIEYVASHGPHYLTLGSNNRYSENAVGTGSRSSFVVEPEKDGNTITSLFLHDTTTITDSWQVDIGVRYEKHNEAGDNVQGTLRTMWSPTSKQRFWMAASKADGTPSRLTTGANRSPFAVIPGGPMTLNTPTLVQVVSQNDGSSFDNTELIAYEIGYRLALSETVTIDATAFYNDYSNLFSVDDSSISTPVPVLEPISGNFYIPVEVTLSGDEDFASNGFEIAVNWRLPGSWYLQYSGSYINFKEESLFSGPISNSLTAYNMGVDSPTQQHSLRLSGDLSEQWSAGFWLRYVGELKQVQIDSYTVVDTHLSYQPHPNLRFGLTLKNLGDPDHLEAVREAFYFDAFEVEQSVTADVQWKF